MLDDSPSPILYLDSITVAGNDTDQAVIVSGSHGGVYPAYLAVTLGAKAVILNDAGRGLEDAGIASLEFAQPLGMAAATVAHDSCRIGDTEDMRKRGVISEANATALGLGVKRGLRCEDAAKLMARTPPVSATAGEHAETRRVLTIGTQSIALLDSASLVSSDDAGRIVITGSHGGLIGGDPRKALKADALFAAFNDAGVGADNAGVSRLPALQARGIAAVTVAHTSARIGDAYSSYSDGIVSHANGLAMDLGATPNARLRHVLDRFAREHR